MALGDCVCESVPVTDGVDNALPLCVTDAVPLDVGVAVDDGVALPDRLCVCVCDGVPLDDAVPPWLRVARVAGGLVSNG